jgi:hypothetical protein
MKSFHQSIKFGIKGRAVGSKVQYVQESSRNALAFQFIHLFISMYLPSAASQNHQPTLKYTHLSFLPSIKKGSRCSRAAEMTLFHPKRQPCLNHSSFHLSFQCTHRFIMKAA